MPRALPCSAPSSPSPSAELVRARGLRQAIKKQALRLLPCVPGVVIRIGCPGRARAATRARNWLLLGGLLLGGLFRLRLLRLLRFLSHSILSGFHGLNATPRHAWRRASLATSSVSNSADSEAAAACCHRAVIVLSTAVTCFRQFFASVRVSRIAASSHPSCLTTRKRLVRESSSIQNHGADWRAAGESPLSGAAASCP